MHRAEIRRTLRRLETLARDGIEVLSALEVLADRAPKGKLRRLNKALSDIEAKITTLLQPLKWDR